MKRRLVIILVCLTVFMLCGCCLSHEWQEATCTEPKTCSKCGKTEGEALGHTWEEATCTKAKTCSICGQTEGKPLGHQATPATCTEDSVCSVCGEIVAKAKGHNWVEATAVKPKTCKRCGLTEGEPLGYPTYKWNEPQTILNGLVVVLFEDDSTNPLGRYGFLITGAAVNVDTLKKIVRGDLSDNGLDTLISIIEHTMEFGDYYRQNGVNLFYNENWETGSKNYAFSYTTKEGQAAIGLYSDKENGITHYYDGIIE